MSTRPNRETAYRVFAAEFDDASLSYAESDEERAPNYVVTPTGARLNRLFVVGVLTEIESVNDEQLRARIVDPTGAFVVYAGQYQPEALSFLERAETPAFVAVTGKARTFQPDDSERVFTSIRPETMSEVDAATRDRFAVDTAAQTVERVRTMREARERDERGDAFREALESEGVEAGLAAGVPRALDHYDTTLAYLDAIEELAFDAARVVAGEREEVGSLAVAPDDRSTGRTEPTDSRTESETEPAKTTDEAGTESAAGTGDESVAADDTAIETEPTDDSPVDVEAEPSGETDSARETDESTPPQTTTEPLQPDAEREAGSTATDIRDETDGTSEGIDTETDDESAVEVDLDDPEEFEIDDDERERIEQEFGTDFESAAEVDEPGAADIETPAPEEPDEADSIQDEAAGDDETSGTDAASDAETDPEEAVVAAMTALDDGDGAEREAVIERVGDEHGLSREAAADGIQSALMSGECYEPDDDTLKPI
jgi:RPA family protein